MQETGAFRYLATRSITFAIKMDVKLNEQIKKVDQFFKNVWSPERYQLIQLLERKEKELQEQKKTAC